MGEVERPRLYRTLRSFLVPQMRMPMVSLWWLAPEHVVDEGDVEVELAGVFRLELARLELDNHIAGLLDVEEKQIHVEVIAVDVEVDLAADEGEAGAEFAEGFGDPAGQGVLEVAFGDFPGEAEEFEVVGIFGDLLGQFGILGNKLLRKVRRRCARSVPGSCS